LWRATKECHCIDASITKLRRSKEYEANRKETVFNLAVGPICWLTG
jgi:hypothetical protein